MKKYNIEGSIDFFSELYKSLDDEEEENEQNDDNLCLITNLPLNNNFFKMDCGHKFNYIPLYLDIKNHKQKFNGMEGNSSRLNKNEIRCPYCRNRHKGVLPYYEELGLPKVDGVNYVNPNYKTPVNTSGYYKTCHFLTPNPNFNPDGENASETNAYNNNNINCKYFLCFHMGSKINFQYGQETGENYGDDKYYCWNHKKQIIKKYKTDIAVKAKEEAKKQKEEAKQQIKKQKEEAKEEVKKQKEEAKQKAKEEKQKQKEEAKQKTNNKKTYNKNTHAKPSDGAEDNIVLGPTVIISGNEINICVQIIKSGTNKGNLCGCKVYQDNKCKRHMNKVTDNNTNK
jgi:hypothetical protein